MRIDYSSLLNEAQLQAVTTKAQNVRVIAGAGSGKTRALTYRIAYLVDAMEVDPHRILAVTFTNKAAKEMQTRVANLLPEVAGMLQVRTFHSFCSYFLRLESRCFGFPPSFTILDEEESEKLVKDIAESKGYKRGDSIVKEAIHYIRAKKAAGVKPEEVKNCYRESDKIALDIYREYEERKFAMVCLDFDDLIVKTIEVLSGFPEIRERWSRRYEHILVDEFQDTNDSQEKVISLLSRPDTCVYVVGDPDQTIYTWRGADQNIILNFPLSHPGTEDVFLSRNYRSTKNILDVANKLIAHNKKRVPKDLFTLAPSGDPVTARKFFNAQEEAAWVAGKIEALSTNANPVAPDFTHIAVLYRSSYLTRPFETEFAARGIPYRIYGGLRFYQRKEVKDVLAYFNLLVNPKNDVAFERIANVPRRNIGETSLERLSSEAKALGLSEYEYAASIDSHPETELPSRVVNSLIALTGRMEEVKKQLQAADETYSSILKTFLTDIGYFEYIAKDQDIDEDRAGNVNSLFEDIDRFISEHQDASFAEYLQNVTLLTSQDDINDGNYVSLMTVHVAKGLEFDDVFIIGLNDGTFPNGRSMGEREDGEEEERRLCYVAMTRAKRRLFLTCNTGYSYQSDGNLKPSQFFEESGIKFPKSAYSRDESFGPYRRRPSFEKVYRQKDYFGDGDSLSPFENKKEAQTIAPEMGEEPKTNGVTHWSVGDKCVHDAFGEGVVTKIKGPSIIEVDFSGARKTLLSTHPKLHKKAVSA